MNVRFVEFAANMIIWEYAVVDLLYDLSGVLAVSETDAVRVPRGGTRGGYPRRGSVGGGCARRRADAGMRRPMPRDERNCPVEHDPIMDYWSAACSHGKGSEGEERYRQVAERSPHCARGK